MAKIRPRITKEFLWVEGKSANVTSGNAAKDRRGQKEVFGKLVKHGIFTGISYMIPAIVAGGVMMGVSGLVAVSYGIENIGEAAVWAKHPNLFWVIMHYFSTTGGLLFSMMFPFFAGFTAYGIADRQGLVPGFLGGLLANQLGAGFFGALVIGLFAGFMVRWLNRSIKIPEAFITVKSILLVPLISTAVVVLLMVFILGPFFSLMNLVLKDWLVKTGETGPLVYAAVVAGAMAFDLGGPVNKAALTISLAFALDHVLPLTACMMGIVIAPIGVGLATIIDRYVVGCKVYDDNFCQLGKTSMVLGMLGISEGAIPFALENPLFVVPVNVIGTMLAACLGIALGAELWLPLSAIWAWPFVTNMWAWVVGVIAGVMFIALLNIWERYRRIKKGQLKLNEE